MSDQATKAEKSVVAPRSAEETTFADKIGLVVGGQFVSAIIGLVQGILLVRLLDKRAYGTISLVLFLHATARELGMLYIPESILYFAPKANSAELISLVRQSMKLLFGLGVAVALIFVLLGLAPGIFLNGRTDVGALLLIAGLVAIVGFPASVYGNVFIATDNHRRAAGISLILTLFGAAGSLIPAALGWPLATILAFMVASQLLRIVLSERLLRTMFGGTTPSPFPGGIRAQIKYVLPLSITRFAGIFNQKLDRFIVGLFFGAESFAEFAIGSQELPLVSILPYTIASTMMPKLVELCARGTTPEQGARDAIVLWHAGMRKATIVMVPIAVFLLLMAEPFMVVLYGDKYRAAALPFRIYSALMLVRITGYGTMLMVFGKTKELMKIQIFGMVLNVGASFLLLPRIGMIAAPLGAVLTQVSMIVAILSRVDNHANVGVRGIFPWWHWFRTVLAAAIAAASAAGLGLLLPVTSDIIRLVVGLLSFAVAYLFVANGFGVFVEEDREFIRRWLRLTPFASKSTR